MNFRLTLLDLRYCCWRYNTKENKFSNQSLKGHWYLMNSGKFYYTLHDYGVLKLHHATTLSLVTSCSYEHHGIKPCLNCPSSFTKLLHILFSFVFTDCFKRLFNKSQDSQTSTVWQKSTLADHWFTLKWHFLMIFTQLEKGKTGVDSF